MKKTLFLLATLIFLSGFRAPNGDIISDFDPVDKLLLDMGQPLIRTPVMGTNKWGVQYVISETWVYQIDNLTYRFTIENGVITSIKWTR